MKTTEKDGRTILVPENDTEEKALNYLNEHRPFFAIAEEYMLNAYMAGYDAGRKDALILLGYK